MQSIKIHNLGPIVDCEVEITDFMVLTGQQSAGKSTVAKSIFFFKNIPILLENELKTKRLQSSLQRETVGLSLKNKLIRSIRFNFLRTFGSTWGMDMAMYIEYRYTEDVSIKVMLKEDSNRPNYIWIEMSKELNSFLDQLERYDRGTADFIVQDKIRGFFGSLSDIVYIPAGRSMLTLLSDQLGFIYGFMDDAQKRDLDYCTQNYLELILKLKLFFNKDIPALISDIQRFTDTKMDKPLLEQAQRLIFEILQGHYKYENGEEHLYLENGHYVKINFSSSGQQETVWILNVLFYYLLNNKSAYFIIEEPESHLYPNVQKLMTEFIALAKTEKNQILVTTHSPYVLGTLNNLLYAGGIEESVDRSRLDGIVSSGCRIRSDRFAAYYVSKGHMESCMDEDREQILHEVIDGASEKINEDFDEMLRLESGDYTYGS